MKDQQPDKIAYVLKRYPRLSETFILNEIRALERLGTRLHIFSLLQAEESLAHSTVEEVRAPVTYLPAPWIAKSVAVLKAHAEMAAWAPMRYLHALLLVIQWSVRSRKPHSVLKQFMRAAYIASGCRRNNIRHIHAHFANAPATVARLVSVLSAIPHSFTTHAKDLYLTPQKVLRRRIQSAQFVLTCTGYNLQYLRSFARPEDLDKIHLIYHGIDLAEFVAASNPEPAEAVSKESDDTPLILSVGRLVPKKGMSDLLFAFHLLMKRGVKFRAIIVGEGPLRRQLETEILVLRLERYVQLPGAMAHDRLVGLYKQASLFALAPRVIENGDRDGIPNVLAEAMASGVPVVTTKVSGIPELVEDGRTGMLVDSKNPEALADAIEQMLRDAALRQKLAVSGREKIESSFQCWETAKELYKLLPEAI